MSSSSQECPICLETLGMKNVVTTDCGHTFHFSCMIANMKNSTTCPLCRGVVDDEPRLVKQLENLTYEDVEDMEHSITELTGRNQETSRAIMTYIASQMARNSSSTLTGHMEVGVRGILTRYVSEIVHDFVHVLGEWSNAEGDTPTIRSEVVVGPFDDADADREEGDGDEQTLSDVLCNYYLNMCSAAALGDPLAIRFREWIRDHLAPDNHVGSDTGYNVSYYVCNEILADQESRNWRRAAELIFSEMDTPTARVRSRSESPVGVNPITPIRVPEEIHDIDNLPDETINYIDCIINTNFELNEINLLNDIPEFQIINDVGN